MNDQGSKENPSQNAAKFVRQLAERAYRLAAKDIVVTTLRAEWSCFGSWELHAERGAEARRYAEGLLSSDPMTTIGPEVMRVFWDGRDRLLSVENSPTRFCSVPNEWKTECTKGFDNPDNALIRFVEEYVTNRLAG